MKKWEIKDINSWDWKKHPLGGIIPESGTAATYPTGGWRSQRPVRDDEACNNCLLCFVFCPDSAIKVRNEQMDEISLEHCKGCGICARECPRKAIEMVDEVKAQSKERGENKDA